jgi:hypothetical protein
MARTGCGQQVLMHMYMLSYYCITCAQHTGHHHCFLLPSQLAQFAHHTCRAHQDLRYYARGVFTWPQVGLVHS